MRRTARPPLRRPLSIALGLTLVGQLALVACSGDDEPDPGGEPSAAAAPPALDAAWSVPPDTSSDREVVTALTSPTTVVVADSAAGLTALDPATGETRWTDPRTVQVCLSSNVTAAGMVAVAVGRGGTCRTLVVYDVATGERAWQQRIADAGIYGQVAISDTTVTYHQVCTGNRRWDLATGRTLPRLPLSEHCRGLGISAEAVVGTTVVDNDVRTVGVYDPDTGRRLTRVRGYDSPGLEVTAVVSADPLVVDVTRRGHRLLRVIGADGRAGTYLGDQLDNSPTGTWRTLGVEDGVLVGVFDQGSLGYAAYGLDLVTGERLWRLDALDALDVLGLQDGGILSAHRVDGDYWLERADLRDPERSEVLGRFPGSENRADDTMALAGDRLVVLGSVASASYDVPAHGDGTAYQRPPSTIYEAPVDPDAWADGDVRPDDVEVRCRDVGAGAFRTLGWGADAGLPTSSTCRWDHVFEGDDGRTSRVATRVVAVAPRQTGDGADLPAVAAAEADVREVLGDEPTVGLPGVGDEAWLQRPRAYRQADQQVVVTVRLRNLVVEVDVSLDAVAGPRSAAATRRVVDRAALQLLGELLAPYDVTPPGRLPVRVA